MRYGTILGLFLLVACQPSTTSNPPVVSEKPVIPHTNVPQPVVSVPLDPIAAVAVLPPKQLKAAASKSLTDADHYVAWKMSRRENIETLTHLTEQLTGALTTMAEGHNKPKDVIEARKALKALRVFLVTKED